MFAITMTLMLAAALPPAALQSAAAMRAPDADAIATDRLRDLQMTMIVVQANGDELTKIGGDFRTSYRFKRMDIAYKSPNKTRLETRILGRPVTVVYNGGKKFVHVLVHKETRDITNQPGQKQSLLNLGIFAKDFLATDYQAAYLRAEKNLHVYRLNQRHTTNKAFEIVWVNPKTAVIEKRKSFGGDGKLRMETRHTKIVQPKPGVWVPMRVEVYNQFGKLAGVQEFQNLRVNVGVPDSTFATS